MGLCVHRMLIKSYIIDTLLHNKEKVKVYENSRTLHIAWKMIHLEILKLQLTKQRKYVILMYQNLKKRVCKLDI